MANEEQDIMELRERFLHQEVQIRDGSSEDGQYGYVVGVTAKSAEPITVLFYTVGPVRHCNYYTAAQVTLTRGIWHEGKERDQSVRCRKSRFDNLWHVIDGQGLCGPGAGTEGIAWNRYLRKLAAKLAGKEDHGKATNSAAHEMADGTRQDGGLAVAADEHSVSHGMELDEGDHAPEPCEREEASTTDRT